ncbi:glycine--tRNA ligase subunit beta [Gracilibacillus alcaliphilus]|uniref:glycine--tRNA ligase subunit beta n=1 Tax=Gracilibacillus alcaliphilus TaxID=1401441 RepID=UPI001956010B|nr:glycine--tRNA ligase subunit beta [Gracilibacillus alcaliphilus]MBM7674996.1 glycyl-tRNA synthetase beta chain [Gracilibacillus alcaliphilus]
MKTTNVLFEVGLEEMPARFMDDTEQQLKQKTIEWLQQIRLPYQEITTFITPRRFAVLITGLADKQPDQTEEAKGPALKIAKDDQGNWSKAAIGFSKGQGKSVDDLFVKEVKGTEYIFVEKFIEGRTQEQLLPAFKDIILSLNFPKNMRWSNENMRYIRPIKWLVALKDQAIIPFEIAGVKTGRTSKGHRFLGGSFEITDPSAYEEQLAEQYVIAKAEDRKQRILSGIAQLEKEQQWVIPVDLDLLTEVTNLVEYPTVFYGQFSQDYLQLPKEVLTTSMKEHQRYFPVQNNQSELLSYFIGVRNGTEEHIDTVARGNEKVLRARLQDAQFFFEEDQKQSIATNLKRLERMVFQEKLGTIADKVKRVINISRLLADMLQLSDKQKFQIKRTAQISKFDLVTNMVTEFTELQGIMGRKYAEMFGEDPVVAQAIEEHYMPRNTHDRLPETAVGAVVSIADKLDTVVGCFGVGLIPSGSQDPYALRRQALGILQIIQDKEWDLNLDHIIAEVLSLFKQAGIQTESYEQSIDQIEAFFKQRSAYIMKEAALDSDIIEAVLASQLSNFSFLIEKGKLLQEKKADPDFKSSQEAFVRVLNLAVKAEETTAIKPELFENEQEAALYQSYLAVKEPFDKGLTQKNAKQALTALIPLVEPIHLFFDHTMVMAEDPAIRQNRLALLLHIAELLLQFADLTKVQWKQHS